MAISRFATSTVSQGLPKYQKFWDGVAELPGSFESIQTVTVGSGGSSTITFSSIPQTYKHLQIRGIARIANNDKNLNMHINGDGTTSNYGAHVLYGEGSSATAVYYSSNPQIGWMPGSAQTASVFGGIVIDILDYNNTAKFKTSRSLGSYDANGSGFVWYASNLWRSTSAITSISLSNSYYDFAEFSHFALYGIKG